MTEDGFNDDPFAKMVAEARTRKGWTLRDLEQEVSINRTSLSHYENGICQPMQREKVEQLARSLDIPPEALLSAWNPSLRERVLAHDGKIWCPSCREWKEASEFREEQTSPTGRHSCCKSCHQLRRHDGAYKRRVQKFLALSPYNQHLRIDAEGENS